MTTGPGVFADLDRFLTFRRTTVLLVALFGLQSASGLSTQRPFMGQKPASRQTAAQRDAQVHYKASVLALQHQDLALAEQELQQAIKLAPGNATFWFHLAEVQLKRDEVKDAVTSLDTCKRLGVPAALRKQFTDLAAELDYKSLQTQRDESLRRYLGTWSIPEWNRNLAPDAQNCPADGMRHSFTLMVSDYDPQGHTLQGRLSAHWSMTAGCGRKRDIYVVACTGTWDVVLGMFKEQNPDQLYLKGTHMQLTQTGSRQGHCEFEGFPEFISVADMNSDGTLTFNYLPGFGGRDIKLSKQE
jgi:hypothetical protein